MRNIAAKTRLFEIADGQQGFFTAQQALEAGYVTNNHDYHVKAGNWIRRYRGIYQLAHYPSTQDDDLVLWSLWSRKRGGHVQGVYSHQTALRIYDLSDANPAKLHMTVPKGFLRSAPIPKVLILYYENIDEIDIEYRQGFAVTKPFKSLCDLVARPQLSLDILYQAIEQAQKCGLISKEERKYIESQCDNK